MGVKHFYLFIYLSTCATKNRLNYSRINHFTVVLDLYKGFWNPQRKIGVAMHFFEIHVPKEEKDFHTIATNLAIWLASLPLSMRVQTTLLASMCHAMPFSAHTLKNIFFDVDIVVKNKSICGLAWSVLLSTTICIITVVKICCGLTRRRLPCFQFYHWTWFIINSGQLFFFHMIIGNYICQWKWCYRKNEAVTFYCMLCQVIRRVNTTHVIWLNTLA